MKLKISKSRMNIIKRFIFQQGRLIERKYYQYFFEHGSPEDCVAVIRAYQNRDGGFGNGIEPDILCPDSSGIGMETAFYYLDMLELPDQNIIDKAVSWLLCTLNPDGSLPHPPQHMAAYPHQPWWNNPDTPRILSIVSYLKKWDIACDELYEKVRPFTDICALPHPLAFYDYPYYLYLKYFPRSEVREIQWKQVNVVLPELIEKEPLHYPLIGRHWYLALDNFSNGERDQQIQRWLDGLQEDGGLEILYKDLPWWRPIWTLDGLMVMKKFALVEFEE